MLVLVLLPLVMIQIEKRISITDRVCISVKLTVIRFVHDDLVVLMIMKQSGMQKIRVGLMFVACTVLLYLSWYSWISSLFVALFFFPTLSGIALSLSLSSIGQVILWWKDIQGSVLDWTHKWLLYFAVWFIVVSTTFIAELSWFMMVIATIVIILLLPPIISDVLILAAKGFASNVLAEGAIGALWVTLNILHIYYLLRWGKRKSSNGNENDSDDTPHDSSDATSTMDENDHQQR
jgi:hypothetical protein